MLTILNDHTTMCSTVLHLADDLSYEFCLSQRYTPLEIIGVGSFGVVATAIDHVTQRLVAVKKVELAPASSGGDADGGVGGGMAVTFLSLRRKSADVAVRSAFQREIGACLHPRNRGCGAHVYACGCGGSFACACGNSGCDSGCGGSTATADGAPPRLGRELIPARRRRLVLVSAAEA